VYTNRQINRQTQTHKDTETDRQRHKHRERECVDLVELLFGSVDGDHMRLAADESTVAETKVTHAA